MRYKKISKREEYLKLLNSGMFWELYPELSGNWEHDSKNFINPLQKMNREEKINVTEVLVVIQGEGKYTGHPSFLIRTSGCNLNCQFKGSLCDASRESWNHDNRKNKLYSLNDIDSFIKSFTHINRVFITGGNPTTNKKMFLDIVKICRENNLTIDIEDNGTQFSDDYKNGLVDFVSLSPKLKNSIPVVGSYVKEIGRSVTESDKKIHEKNYRNLESLRKWIRNFDYQLKFVISDEQDILEVKDLVSTIGASWDRVYFMPEGSTREQIESKRKWLYEKCRDMGVKYTDRLHILVYDDIKGV